MENERWILPDGIDEVLPPEAGIIERKRRELLDLYGSWGYDFVIPPFVEFLDSLLTGTGSDLDLNTFKLTDQLSGRMMGIRADITPQAARIDAHHIRSQCPTRLCYLGTVLHTRSDGFAGTRSPLQIGAELYGHSGVESDIEVLRLMMETLRTTGVEDVYLDLGHVGIYKGLAEQAGLNKYQERELFAALQRKAMPEVERLLDAFAIDPGHAAMLARLGALNGDNALRQATELLREASDRVKEALHYLQMVADQIALWLPQIPVHFDLAELRGYHFHTGVVFAAFVPGSGKEIARGGRYDAIGSVFGRSRPATGFSTDLKTLIRVARQQQIPDQAAVFAPWSDDPGLQREIERLRAAGQRVICALPGQYGGAKEMGCNRELVLTEGQWRLITI
ncbi:MAG: ATP phosphoribosyltransferase regulatory subunit [Candidatus Thiodiazotropha sp.]|nr:ATP phosphoribosyltransferase regulatory subunit [Candidatus Thiodiazotropha taylori]MBT3059199.1 ATP phosphoribosyltransferase regulatory subunit [Candidatus Thiodiazotropha sp. (ex Lucina pensylvanica)]MBV2094147.1 ATP phosphoribosyltransferase regulatory subunit [Candidatus Thiodiazotropha sp. (ex Codakia orbicularis)]PUB71801.1 MAG: ATP phosphoribosyltransferase regulatory subunit [gamma proteobacterium symbiont of Ctena orbiculata]MBT3061632.1 ATP phosphoribosyltransferase regulatory su